MHSMKFQFFIILWLQFFEIWSGSLYFDNSQTFSEQIDLLGLNVSSSLPYWTESTNIETVDDFEDDRSSQKPQMQPFDEVEQIEPRQWPHRGAPIPTRSTTSPDSSLPFPPKKLPNKPTTAAQRNPTTQRYPTITAPPPTVSAEEVFCDFGSAPAQTLCDWQNGEGALKWIAGAGSGTNWVGGPSTDSTTNSLEGGYAFLETSHLPQKDEKVKSVGGLLHSPQLGNTGPSGYCLMFKFVMDGLSITGLRVLLHRGLDEYAMKKENPDEAASLDNATTTVPTCEEKPLVPAEERVIWNAQYFNFGNWQQAQILYTFPEIHSVIIEGLPVEVTDPSRLYRGYIAIDDIDLQPGSSCVGFCNFASDFCDWSNDAEDDFDWTISRGSSDPTTGPTTDSSTDRSTAGGYAYIDSKYPRRPGDIARLISTSFPATGPDTPICMSFWFHMFGSGIGHLRLYLRHFRNLEGQLQVIWELSGNAGNSWFPSEVTIGSLDDFQLIFEASVGVTAMGDIAIDDIMFTPGPCPISPQVAAPSRDCTFEIDECEWINSRDPDRVDWERLSTQVLSPRHQRKLFTSSPAVSRRNDYFLSLAKVRGGPRVSSGGTAQLISREMKATGEPLCVTFWYFMFESFIDATGPSLGILRVLVQPVDDNSKPQPIWQLYNNQGPTWYHGQANINENKDFSVIFESTWGPNRASGSIAIDDITFYTGNCTVRPSSATVNAYDCSFEKDLCGWENMTSTGPERAVTWQRAFQAHRPAQLLDKTFGATGDFVFFDIFTTNQKSADVQLRSPLIQVSNDDPFTCFTFWFAAFGVEESTTLRVLKVSTENNDNGEEEEGANEPLWSLTAKGFNNPKPVWMAAQVSIEAQAPYYLILEGSASNGGFAIDDIKFQTQQCQTRPLAAQPVTNTI